MDLTDENITANTVIINSQGPDKRLQYLMERLVTHLHDFARETQLTTEEWMKALVFLKGAGQISSDTRQLILLSDVLGLSTLVEAINNPKPANATEGSVLGPFHTDDAHFTENGESIASPNKGELCLVRCTLRDTSGKPIPDAKIDVWETDDTGRYDTQYEGRTGPDCRGVLKSNKDGEFWFKCVKPVSYPIPHDGPVGKLLVLLRRHPFRPAHLHFKIEREGFDPLITALYLRGDPYEISDAVFGVKSSLIVTPQKVRDPKIAGKYGVGVNDWYMPWDFVLVGEAEGRQLKKERALAALEKMGCTAKIVDGLPVAHDVD
ncbi:aromatic compound dioxygenase [Choiromyces venosus 120613-1]|uniref:Aromatic compound dioxygenase n=1 Tax=Choiromyces venosus 120613-1 TaxID=1336337 RepID=A0A3N4KHG5_9PEZI|nr:aromatic compound dioxygenase [Choiromyces venosus 120613-1]